MHSSVLILRAITLIIAFCVVLCKNWNAKKPVNGLGDVAVLWLSFTWISTVILGVPICSAVFGKPSLGLLYGLMAGMSSFIFQLPLQLIFFEYHVIEQRWTRDIILHAVQPVPVAPAPMKDSTVVTVEAADTSDQSTAHSNEVPSDDRMWWSIVNCRYMSQTALWFEVLKRLYTNPILIALFVGFVLSLSTAGKYLRCPSDTCIAGLQWIGDTLGWLGNCVSPLSLLAMGSWMRGQHYLSSSESSMPILKLCFFMVFKLIAIPLLMVGLAKLMRLNDEAGRAAILIASLPISMASFSLGHQYNVGEKDLSANVTAGTVLMLPTIIVWNLVLDAVSLYPL